MVTIDLDPTEDPAHGEQQLALFNGHYGNWCYLPLLAFVSFDDEPDQYLVTALLRPGNSPDKRGAIGVLSRILPRLRASLPQGPLPGPSRCGLCGPGGARLPRRAGRRRIRRSHRQELHPGAAGPAAHGAGSPALKGDGKTEHVYAETRYATKSWSCEAPDHHQGRSDTPPRARPQGQPPLRRHQHDPDPALGLRERSTATGATSRTGSRNSTSASRSTAPAARASSPTSSASSSPPPPMSSCRSCGSAARTKLARAQVSTLRDRLLKIGARVHSSVRRIVLQLPMSFPDAHAWGTVARSLGASAG